MTSSVRIDEVVSGPRSLSEQLGPAFWLSLMWIVLIAVLAASADLWQLAEVDQMNWDLQVAPPGTLKASSLSGHSPVEPPAHGYYLLGTDTMGRDIFARLIFGARISIAVGLIAPFIGLMGGGFLGLLAGYYHGRLEAVILAAMDTVLAFPGMVLLLAVTFYLGPRLQNIIFALGLLTVPTFARVSRANTMAVAEREFVQAARMLGQSDIAILFHEIVPNVIMPLVVYALVMVSYMIIAEGALSFLGLGVPAPTPSWGGMIAEGREVLEEAPHVSLIPAAVMFLTVLSFNLMGDALRGVCDAREAQL